MAKFYNCSDKKLWEKGMAYLFAWIYIGLFGYIIFIILHKPVVNLGNSLVTIIWGAVTLGLLIYWYRRSNKLFFDFHSWICGYMGEWYARRELKKLPDDYHVIYDVFISDLGGNIDFIVVCKFGVFAIEVKVSSLFDSRNRKQARKQAKALQEIFDKNNLKNINYVYPVLVYIAKSNVKQTDNDRTKILGRKNVYTYFTKNMPIRSDKNFNKDDIEKIISVITKGKCKIQSTKLWKRECLKSNNNQIKIL